MKIKLYFSVVLAGTLLLSVSACAKTGNDDSEKKLIQKEVTVKVGADSCEVVHIIINKDGEVKEYSLKPGDLKNMGENLAFLSDDELMKHFNLKVEKFNRNHAFLGVSVQDMTTQLREFFKADHDHGVLVAEVIADSPAEKAGILSGDVIMKVGDEDIDSPGDLTSAIGDNDPGNKVDIVVIRDGKSKKISATLAEAPGFPRKAKMFFDDKSGLDDPKMLMYQSDDLQKQMDELKSQLEELKTQLKEFKKK